MTGRATSFPQVASYLACVPVRPATGTKATIDDNVVRRTADYPPGVQFIEFMLVSITIFRETPLLSGYLRAASWPPIIAP